MASQNSFSASGQRRRRSSAAKHPPNLHLDDASQSRHRVANSTGGSYEGILPPIPGTPAVEMSRSPSPRPGGWSSPGLNTPYDSAGRTSPFANGSSNNVTWASAQARSANVKGHNGFTPRNQGFFGKHFRRISTSLPFSYGEKEKLGRGRGYQGYQGNNKILQALNRIGWNLWRLRKPLGTILTILLLYILFYVTRMLLSFASASCTDHHSLASSIPALLLVRRRQQVRRHPRSEPGWWCDGVEGAERMGD